ncbi:MAG: transketolase [Desulfuromonadaceae bacterium]|nr:transketolase [Desulfuromonadaceae bacterium]MDD2855344.1 transketolase [Desulfuromonadaceae bacterium]
MVVKQIKQAASQIRRDVIEMAFRSGGPHVGGALSCVDILAALYHKIMQLENWEERDIFILSKAHAAMALYSTLVSKGIMSPDLLETYCQEGGRLPAHLDRFSGRGIECSAGSLGHGFNIGLGVASGFKQRGSTRRVFVLIGDGEAQEGSVWEGALFAPTMGLDNFTAIMDYNDLQGYGSPSEICCFEPVASKWSAFGWYVCEIDGHDHNSILRALAEDSCGKPKMIIARTVKGKGVSFMENQLIWHYYIVTAEHRLRALEELQ